MQWNLPRRLVVMVSGIQGIQPWRTGFDFCLVIHRNFRSRRDLAPRWPAWNRNWSAMLSSLWNNHGYLTQTNYSSHGTVNHRFDEFNRSKILILQNDDLTEINFTREFKSSFWKFLHVKMFMVRTWDYLINVCKRRSENHSDASRNLKNLNFIWTFENISFTCNFILCYSSFPQVGKIWRSFMQTSSSKK